MSDETMIEYPTNAKADFEAAGGPGMFTTEQLTNAIHNVHVDEAKWQKAKEESQKEYGHIKWAFVQYLYQKLGGK